MRRPENGHETGGGTPLPNGNGHAAPQNGHRRRSTTQNGSTYGRSIAVAVQTFEPETETPRRADVAQKIEHTIDYMKQHLDEPVRASTLAAVANMSLPHYFALFKRRIGGTPIDYFIKLRMEHARRLLAETSWSVKEVAATLGYEDPLYFSRVFKSINLAPPSHYRLSHNGTNGNGTKADVLPRKATNGHSVAGPQPKMKDGR